MIKSLLSAGTELAQDAGIDFSKLNDDSAWEAEEGFPGDEDWDEDDDSDSEDIVEGDEDPEDSADPADPEASDEDQPDDASGPERDEKGRFKPKKDDAPADPSAEVPAELAGKTPAELAKMVLDAQQFAGRQSSEVGELRQQMQQFQQMQQQMLAQQHQAASAGYADDLTVDAPIDPVAAYGRALQLLDTGHIDIGTMEQVLEQAHEVNPTVGRRLDRDFAMRLARAEAMANQRPTQDFARKEMVRQASEALLSHPEFGDDAKEFAPDIVKALRGRHLGNSPEDAFNAMHAELVHNRGLAPIRTSAYRQALAAAKANDAVETGNATPPPPPKNENDLIRERLFSRKQNDPSRLLLGPLK